MHRFLLITAGLLAALASTARAASPGGPTSASLLAALAAGEGKEDCFPALVAGEFKYRGARTCQSAACHGSLDPRPGAKVIRRNEFTLWRDKDPHAKAFASINPENQRARDMLERLGIAKGKQIVDQAGHNNCKKCHNLTIPAAGPLGAASWNEGVSCEACHGPSDKWYDAHFKVGFDRKVAIAKSGMIDTQNLFVRARLCAQCHVGAPDREVNHDLIAAGHPQMRFEMAAYLHLVPKHWHDEQERDREQFELQLWVAGQIASADAALGQLAARAQGAVSKPQRAVWPEFAESDCFACHHDLAYPSWRQQRGYASRNPGNLPWGSWYYGLLDRAAQQDGESQPAKDLHQHLAQLGTLMEGNISPDPQAVAKAATAARAALCQWAKPDGALVVAAARPARMNGLFGAFAGEQGPDKITGEGVVENWELATQLYLAAAATNQAYQDDIKKQHKPETTEDKVLTGLIKQLRGDLAFTAGYDSPHEFGGLPEGAGAKTSPREKVRSGLLQVFQQLQRRGGK